MAEDVTPLFWQWHGLAPVGGTGGNDGSQLGEAEACASSGGGRRLYGPLSRPECAFERGTPETRELNKTGTGGGGVQRDVVMCVWREY